MKESEMQFNLALSCGYQEFENYSQMWEFNSCRNSRQKKINKWELPVVVKLWISAAHYHTCNPHVSTLRKAWTSDNLPPQIVLILLSLKEYFDILGNKAITSSWLA